MDTVFIVIEQDSNDESRIEGVFSSKSKALAFRKELLENGNYEHLFIEEWDLIK